MFSIPSAASGFCEFFHKVLIFQTLFILRNAPPIRETAFSESEQNSLKASPKPAIRAALRPFSLLDSNSALASSAPTFGRFVRHAYMKKHF
jgi:hypothetical protein